MLHFLEDGPKPSPYNLNVIYQNWYFYKTWRMSGGNFAYPGNSYITLHCLNCATGKVWNTSYGRGPYDDFVDIKKIGWEVPDIYLGCPTSKEEKKTNANTTQLLEICKSVSGISSRYTGVEKLKIAEYDVFMDTKRRLLHITQYGNWCTLEDVFSSLMY